MVGGIKISAISSQKKEINKNKHIKCSKQTTQMSRHSVVIKEGENTKQLPALFLLLKGGKVLDIYIDPFTICCNISQLKIWFHKKVSTFLKSCRRPFLSNLSHFHFTDSFYCCNNSAKTFFSR